MNLVRVANLSEMNFFALIWQQLEGWSRYRCEVFVSANQKALGNPSKMEEHIKLQSIIFATRSLPLIIWN